MREVEKEGGGREGKREGGREENDLWTNSRSYEIVKER